jgi:hypothetical protein
MSHNRLGFAGVWMLLVPFSLCWGAGDAATLVLDKGANWRSEIVWSRPVVSVEAQKAAGKEAAAPIPVKVGVMGMASGSESPSFESDTPAPLPAGWKEPAFDDAAWSREKLPLADRCFFAANAIAARTRFVVDDPQAVQGLALSLSYRGGAVVYVNGKEVARVDMPEGEITTATPARIYPNEVWVDAAGKALPAVSQCKGDEAVQVAKRDRKADALAIPASALRKGVNVLAIELHRSDLHPCANTWWASNEEAVTFRFRGWAPLALNDARLTVERGVEPVPTRPKGVQVWNCLPFESVTANEVPEPGAALQPIAIRGTRNGAFSGRLLVGSDRPLKNLKVTVSDLAGAGGASIPSAAVRVRRAEPASPEKSWLPTSGVPTRFDALLDAIPAEIPSPASLWFTVRIPRDAKPGRYAGTVTVACDGLAAQPVPLQVEVGGWPMPDAKDFRTRHFAYLSEDSLALYYNVPRWSPRHFELLGRSMELMAQMNARQAIVNLAINFYGGNKGDVGCSNEETLIRWIRQADGSYTYDFSLFDKYLDTAARSMGKPTLLRVNCWNEVLLSGGKLTAGASVSGQAAKENYRVTRLDPATGKTDTLEQPVPGTEESFAFWKPVLDELRRKVEARGWWDVTALGHNSYSRAPLPQVVEVARRIWPDGAWSFTAHCGNLGENWPTTDKSVRMLVRQADCVWTLGRLTPRGYTALLKPRPGQWCFTFRSYMKDYQPLPFFLLVAEEEISRGHDGVSDFGADLFPLKRPNGRYYPLGNGRGTGGPADSTLAVLAPGADGPVATERFEMLREGVQLAEAVLYVQRALTEQKISGDLAKRAEALLEARGILLVRQIGRGRGRYVPAERVAGDAALLALAGEVAAAQGQN